MSSKRLHFAVPLSWCCCLMLLIAFTCINAASISHIGDVEIYSNETHFKCDRIDCPKEAQRCQVLKEKQNNNSTLVRTNTCYGEKDHIVKQQIYTENAEKQGVITMNMNSYRNGFSSTIQSAYVNNAIVLTNGNSADVQRELDLHLSNAQRINDDVQRQVENINKDIQLNLQNMQQQIHNTFQNIFS